MSPIVIRAVLLVSAVSVLFAEEMPTKPAEGTPPARTSGGGDFTFLIIIVGMFALMYFMLIRPQRKQEKQRREMVAAIKRGDRVITIGGLHGEVVSVGEETVDLRPSKDADGVLTFNKGAISSVVSDDAKAK
jgi:preprotein translocase subunit YajC